jgi:hypothetical protein
LWEQEEVNCDWDRWQNLKLESKKSGKSCVKLKKKYEQIEKRESSRYILFKVVLASKVIKNW